MCTNIIGIENIRSFMSMSFSTKKLTVINKNARKTIQPNFQVDNKLNLHHIKKISWK